MRIFEPGGRRQEPAPVTLIMRGGSRRAKVALVLSILAMAVCAPLVAATFVGASLGIASDLAMPGMSLGALGLLLLSQRATRRHRERTGTS